MKLSKTKKIFLLGATLVALTASIVTPIVLLNKNEDNDEKDINKVFKILEEKKDKTIILGSDSTNKIIADNQDKIIEKIKTLIGKANLKDVKIEILMEKDTNILTTPQKIIIKLTKNEISKEIKDFSVKKQSIIDVDKDIASIKKILDSKTRNDLIITLSGDSTGNIIGNATNKDAIIKKLRILIDPSNTNGEVNHQSLKGTSIEVSMNADAPISTTPQNIIVSISKTNGTTLRTNKTFQVKRNFTADEDIAVIKSILDSLSASDTLITLSSDSTGDIIRNVTNKNLIERKIRMLIDPSNTNGNPNHPSLRGTTITLARVTSGQNDLISVGIKIFLITISKSGGTTIEYENFGVRKSRS